MIRSHLTSQTQSQGRMNDIFNYHFGHLGFGTFDVYTGQAGPHADLLPLDRPLDQEADFVGLSALEDLQSIFITHVVKVDLGT